MTVPYSPDTRPRPRRRTPGRLSWIAALCLFAPSGFAADITVSVDRNPVNAGESFHIVFTVPGNVSGRPDFAPLQQDFDILGQRHSTSISIANGRTTSSGQWLVEVLARRSGQLIIPPIAFAGQHSPPLTIEIRERRPGAVPGDPQGGEVFLEVAVDSAAPYVQQQVLYTARIFLAELLQPGNPSLSEPQLEAGVIKRLGDDLQYTVNRSGGRYRVLERRYAIFPQQSGTRVIAPLEFKAEIGRSRFSFMDPFNWQPQSPSRRIVRRSEAVTLQVKPIPPQFTGSHWLPVKQLRIAEQWSTDPASLQQGEPVTRSLQLEAVGALANQLPALTTAPGPGFRHYPEQAERNDTVTGEGFAAALVQRAAVIPGQAGEMVLPELSVPWWNTAADREEQARLPSRKVTVLAAPAASPQSAAAAPEQSEQPEQSAAAAPGSGSLFAPASADGWPWKWLALGSLALWLVSALAWLLRRRAALPALPRGRSSLPEREGALLRRLRAACQANDARASRDCLLSWARLRWPEAPPHSLGAVAARTPQALSRAITLLCGALYGRGGEQWQGGQGLLQAMEAARRLPRPAAVSDPGGLRPLYPDRT